MRLQRTMLLSLFLVLNEFSHDWAFITTGQVEDFNYLVVMLRGECGKHPETYLGLLLNTRYRAEAVWNQVIERFEKRCNFWKRHYSSKGVIWTIWESTLLNHQVSNGSLFVLLMLVRNQLGKFRRDLLLVGVESARKVYLIRWRTGCFPW